MSKPIGLGIVGLGRAGWGMHLAEIQNKTDKFRVVAACDILPERVEKTQNRTGCRGYHNIDDLIADPDVEIVDIATRSCDHYAHAKQALLAGKSVILEKPVGLNYDQIAELYTLANQPGKPKLYARQNRRFEKGFGFVLDTVRSGILGDVMEISLDVLSYQRRDDWQTIRQFGGGQCLNWGPHIIDQALLLLDSPVAVQFGDLKQAAAGGDCEDHFSIHLIGENRRKVNLCISGSCVLNSGRHYIAYGNRGAVSVSNGHVHLKHIDPAQVLAPVISNPGTPQGSFGSSGTFEDNTKPQWIEQTFDISQEDLTVIWDYIYDSFRNGAPYPIQDEEVLNLMRVITNLFAENKVADFTAHRDSL